VVPQRIERDILIDAPMEIVWAVVTEPEHISGWFSDTVELDLRPGGAAALSWDDYGTVHGRVERVDPPRFFSFRWVVHREPGAAVGDGNSTLVEFSLRPEGDATRLTERASVNLASLFLQLGLVTRAEVEELELRVAQLEHRVRLLEGTPTPPPAPGSAP